MNVLIIGKGGREHALGWKIAQSPLLTRLFFMSGNAGTARIGTTVQIDPHDQPSVYNFCAQEKIDLVVIGPDEYLAEGLTDFLTKRGVRVFGPTKAAAEIEWSKAFAKEFMRENGIPTAFSRTFGSSRDALAYIRNKTFPIVIKANGLAYGKGVVVAQNFEEARRAVGSMLDERIFGDAGKSVVIEEYLIGEEISVHAFCDGEMAILFPPAQDHKRRYENDEGPNTGGMGVVAPLPRVTHTMMEEIKAKIVLPTLAGMKKRGTPFVGVLFPGVMLTAEGPMVIEFNARFGDPETQSYMPLLSTDLLQILNACVDGNLSNMRVEWNNTYACGVALVSDGYPGAYKTGFEIRGLDEKTGDMLIFHAGTAEQDGKTITAGGRVLNIVATANTLPESISRAYEAVNQISFDGMKYRTDIGKKAI